MRYPCHHLARKSPPAQGADVAAGLNVVTEPPELFAQTISNDYEKYGKLIRTIGFQPQ